MSCVRVYRISWIPRAMDTWGMPHRICVSNWGLGKEDARNRTIKTVRANGNILLDLSSVKILKLQDDYFQWVLINKKPEELEDSSDCGRWWADEDGYLLRPVLAWEKLLETGTEAFTSPRAHIISAQEVMETK